MPDSTQEPTAPAEPALAETSDEVAPTPAEEMSMVCKFGDSEPRPIEGICPTCHEPFCTNHASEIDPQYCSSCLTPEKAAIAEAPLRSEDGVVHNGREITPVGPAFKTTGQRIVEMTDDQLSMHIKYMMSRVKMLSQALEYSRIDLSMAELETEERQEKLRAKLRKMPKPPRSSGAAETSSNGSKAAKPKPSADPLVNMAQSLLHREVTHDEAVQLFAALAKAANVGKK